jgi:threonylcarbamoyladenosine tRNA methylthiotransferase MtaB
MPEVSLVLGNREKLRAESYAEVPATGAVRTVVSDIRLEANLSAPAVTTVAGHTRGFLEVQNGCDHRCTFCVIPYGRGNSRSLPPAAAVQQARILVEAGHAEIVLTGVDLTAYGNDLPDRPSLGLLVRTLLKALPELRRLRLSSIDSIEVDGELMRAIAEEERLMPHFHLSLQSGDDLILKRMRRRHARADAIAFTDEVRRCRPDVALGADIIAGFPTEDEAAFQNSVDLVADCGLTFLHVFPFSPRPGTPAARMPQLDGNLIRERASRLRERGAEALAEHLASETGRIRSVLVERGGRGHTEHFTPVEIGFAPPGTIVDVRIASHNGTALQAEPIAQAA